LAIQQLVEVTKALSQDARVLVMDEPTSALNAPEVERLFQLIARLKARGCGLIYITHKMEEIDRVADRITVLRDGRRIGTAPAAELPRDKLLHWMVGRPVSDQFPRQTHHRGTERLRVEGFSVYPRSVREQPAIVSVSFSVAAGEIVGVAGLQGSGASELFLGLFGAFGGRTRGSVYLNGQEVACRHPRQAIRRGMALLTNDRKATGLVLPMSVTANTTLAGLDRLSPGGWCRPPRERRATLQVTAPLNLRAHSLDQRVDSLSGGNQQKVAIGKWLQISPRVLLLDEPTRGIDVGAKQEIYQQMNAWSAEGIAILLVTSEMPELLALSDRLIVLHRGRITARFSRAEATPRGVLAAAMGQQQHSPSTQDRL
jgi:ABC-type sugar transport system ATPase subunit